MTIREATNVIATMTQSLDSEFAKLESARMASQDTSGGENMLDWLESEEIAALAHRAAAHEGRGFERYRHQRLRLVDPVEAIPATIADDDNSNVIEGEFTEDDESEDSWKHKN